MNKLKKIFIPSLLFIVSSCKTTIDEPKPNTGDADFTKYVAIGGSFTSGYADEALYLEGQQNSYPAILSVSFGQAGGGIFKQPLVSAGVGIGESGNAKYILGFSSYSCTSGENFLSPRYAATTGDHSVFNYIGNNGPFNNLGVPGMRSYNLNDQYFGNTSPNLGNPFYARFASDPGNSTILGDANDQAPTFFSLWVGEDDLLPYAMTGGENNNDSIAFAGYPSSFDFNIDQTLMSLTSTTSKGVIANVPDVTDFPFFKTIPYNGLILSATDAAVLNNIFTPIDSSIVFHEGSNPFIIVDAARPSGMRQIKSKEYVLSSVPLDSVKCAHYGSYDAERGIAKPLENKYVLDDAELSLIRSRINGFNSKLKSVAAAKNLAFADMYDFFQHLNNGIEFNGVDFSPEFIHGGAFSLDGIHLTAKGNALIANEFIKAINLQYGSSLHEVDANAYPGIKFP